MIHYLFTVIFVFASCYGAKAQGFNEISAQAGVLHRFSDIHPIGGGVVFFDFNNDGYEDVYLIGGSSADRLFKNNGNGTFEDITFSAGISFMGSIRTRGVVAGDLDNDGFRDLFVTTDEKWTNVLLQNNGDETFSNISKEAGFSDMSLSTSVALGDYNRDGLLDIYVCNYVDYDDLPMDNHIVKPLPNMLYRNLGNNRFVNVADDLGVSGGGASLAVTFTDLDGDNKPDIYIGNDYGYWFEENTLYLSAGDEYEDISETANVDRGINAMGIAVGDYDKDGDLDYYTTNINSNLLHNRSNHHLWFREVATNARVGLVDKVSWGTAFFDYDNDGHLDLMVTNGSLDGEVKLGTSLFQSAGRRFDDVSALIASSEHNGRGLSTGDFDNDGDLDVLINSYAHDNPADGNALLLRNDVAEQHAWLKVKLKGVYSNADGIGSVLKLYLGHEVLLRTIDGGSSFLSQNSTVAHFGLGESKRADSLEVHWVCGRKQTLYNPAVNRLITVVEEAPAITSQSHQICEGDSMLIANEYRHFPGMYYDTLRNRQGQVYGVLETKLTVLAIPKDTVEVYVHPDDYFNEVQIKQDTLLTYPKSKENICEGLTTYKVKSRVISKIQKNIVEPASPYCRGDFAHNKLRLHIRLSEAASMTLYVHDLRGKLIKEVAFVALAGEHHTTFSAETLKRGIYIASLYRGSEKYTWKFVRK